MQRVQLGLVDPSYHFPKPILFVNVTMLEQKKTYLVNWLSACLLWISQVSVHSPSKFPSPQMWRDFLNTIGADLSTSTRSVSMNQWFETFWGKILFMQLRVWQECQKKLSGKECRLVPLFCD
ncbi:hypothetical protein EDC04DRAFT_2582521 [Pisolithus marmoratus]|nr:hypothetical protein EDC04DRAFT_2582521 [Pisolithus marmoratus]